MKARSIGLTGTEGTSSRHTKRPLGCVEERPLHLCLVTDVGATSPYGPILPT